METISDAADKKIKCDNEIERKHRIRGMPFCHIPFENQPENIFPFISSLFLSPSWHFTSIAAAFLATVSGMAAIGGFTRTITTARKQDQKLYEQATLETVNLIDAGTKLATRALAWGTFYAVLGTGTLVYGIWKLSGAKNVNF